MTVNTSDVHISDVNISDTITSDIFSPHEPGEEHKPGIHLASWRWAEVGPYFMFVGFMVVSGLAKIGFHHAHFISSRVPESCLLILVGIVFGAVLEQVRFG